MSINEYNDIENINKAKYVITKLKMWDFLQNYKLPENSGFFLSTNETINKIKYEIYLDNPKHSNISLALTMKTIYNIAKEIT